jgi:hypothetical protein
MVAEAVTNALKDGNVAYQQIQQAVVGYVDGKINCLYVSFSLLCRNF